MGKPSRPRLRPVRDVAPPSLQFRSIHGYRRAFPVAGSGPALLLLHGVGDNSTTWRTVHSALAQRFTVIAPDLLGHGESDKPRADYSLAAFANGMRDLLAVLGIDRVTVVGHSLGGGVAAQFAYQYPHLVERLVLVSSGGVTKDVSFGLRLAAMPMGGEALAVLRVPGALPALQLAGHAARKVLGSTKFGRDLPDGLNMLARLKDPVALSAFSRTLRAVVDGHGQLVTMLDRGYLMQSVPVQLIWGGDDLVIPVSHAHLAHAEIPGSRLEIFKNFRTPAASRPPAALRRNCPTVHRLDGARRTRSGPPTLAADWRTPVRRLRAIRRRVAPKSLRAPRDHVYPRLQRRVPGARRSRLARRRPLPIEFDTALNR